MKKNIIRIAAITGLILLVPFIGTQFSDEVAWNLFDFIIMGVLIFGTGLAYEIISKKAGTAAYRAAAGVALGASFLLVWINLAVGIIGNENNPLNTMYFGVLLLGFAGAMIARLKPSGMARTMFVTAFAQALVPAIALILGKPEVASTEQKMGVAGVFILSWFFAALFAASGLLFKRASEANSKPTD